MPAMDKRDLFVTAALLLTGIIHLIPVTGALSGARLAALYDVSVTQAELLILLRHRAVLFGLVGVFLCVAAFRPDWQLAASLAGLLSMLSFLIIVWQEGSASPAITRVARIDAVLSAVLLLAAVLVVVRKQG